MNHTRSIFWFWQKLLGHTNVTITPPPCHVARNIKAGENRQKKWAKSAPSWPHPTPDKPHTPNPSSDPTRSHTPYDHHQEPQAGIQNSLIRSRRRYHFVSPHQLIWYQHLIFPIADPIRPGALKLGPKWGLWNDPQNMTISSWSICGHRPLWNMQNYSSQIPQRVSSLDIWESPLVVWAISIS